MRVDSGVVLIGAGLLALGFVFVRGEARGLIAAPILMGMGAIFFLSGLGGLKTRDPARGLYLTPTRVVMAPSRERAALFWAQISAIRAIQIEYGIGRGFLHPIQNVLGLAVHDPDAIPELARVRRSSLLRRP